MENESVSKYLSVHDQVSFVSQAFAYNFAYNFVFIYLFNSWLEHPAVRYVHSGEQLPESGFVIVVVVKF